MLIDTHCHLNDPSFAESLPAVIERAEAAGVTTFVVPAYDLPSLERTAELGRLYPEKILPAFGMHPWFLGEPFTAGDLRPFLQSRETIALGEIGLDLSPDAGPEAPQIDAFVMQLDLAEEFDLPVLIHCRKAYDRLYQILRGRGSRVSGILHSFSGSTDMMMRFVDLGFYVSFSGALTRRTARKYHKNGSVVPMDRFVLETDAPSIATETTLASQVEPRHTVEVAQKLAEIKGIPFEEIRERSTENAKRLFRLS
jgi:TatD DNase family protein